MSDPTNSSLITVSLPKIGVNDNILTQLPMHEFAHKNVNIGICAFLCSLSLHVINPELQLNHFKSLRKLKSLKRSVILEDKFMLQ